MRSPLIPTQGQLVEVRQRPFVITDVQLGALPADYLDGRSSAHISSSFPRSKATPLESRFKSIGRSNRGRGYSNNPNSLTLPLSMIRCGSATWTPRVGARFHPP